MSPNAPITATSQPFGSFSTAVLGAALVAAAITTVGVLGGGKVVLLITARNNSTFSTPTKIIPKTYVFLNISLEDDVLRLDRPAYTPSRYMNDWYLGISD